jgi:23S rRNA (uracil1939-C5)-methyltransferase
MRKKIEQNLSANPRFLYFLALNKQNNTDFYYLCNPNKRTMARSKKPLPLLESVEIEAVAAEGKSLFHWQDLVVFVPFCVPGDICDVQIRRKKHSFAEGEVVRFIQYSKVRAIPFCKHFGVCGGCKWQNLPYEEQLKFKQQQVFDQLTRIGKIELPEFRPILGSVKTQEYRNKLDFGCANKRYLTKEEIEEDRGRYQEIEDNSLSLKNRPAIGFHITGAFDKILPIEKCWLMDDLHNQIRNEVRDYAIEHGLSFFDLRQQVGLLRDVIIRNSASGEWMVIIQFSLPPTPSNERGSWDDENGQKAFALMQHIADKFPQITSLLYLDNQKCNDTIGDQEILVFKGEDHIYELMEDLKFKVGPKSFYQTNTEQAYHLYSVAREFAFSDIQHQTSDIKPLVYDLYTGTGTIANFVAKNAQKVIGIEYVPEAIEDAKINSEINGITNTLFYAGDMKDILTDDFIAQHGRPDVIITDPPRAGMHPDVVKTILNAAPKRIVYVSCNPATQARDLQLMDVDYRVVAVQPVDMFPHTPHVENVVLLEHRR